MFRNSDDDVRVTCGTRQGIGGRFVQQQFWVKPVDNRHSVSFAAALLMAVVGCQRAGDGYTQFHQAREKLMHGEFAKAKSEMAEFQANYPTHPFSSRAAFLQAKAELGLGNLDLAEQEFLATINQYPNTEEAHKSRYKLAMIALLRGDRQEAGEGFQQIVDSKSGILVPEAVAMLRMLQDDEKRPLPDQQDEP